MMENLECEKCNYRFSQKSSLVRHSKRCMQGKSQSVRQKSCRECSAAKTRCDLKRPTCSRCKLRQTSCQYAIAFEPPNLKHDELDAVVALPQDEHLSAGVVSFESQKQSTSPHLPLSSFDVFNNEDARLSTIFGLDHGVSNGTLDSSLNLFDTLDLNNPNHQLHFAMGVVPDASALSGLPPATPDLVRHSMEYIFRILRTWPRMMAKGVQLPPMIHPLQGPSTNRSKRLSNCFTVAKMWYGQCQGTSEIVQDTVRKEMREILSSYQTFDEIDLLAALQALSIYILILLFPCSDDTTLPLLDEEMFRQIRQIVYHVATSGLVLEEEHKHTRPSWESWIHVTTKRRAVLTLYLIHWSYSVYHGLPSFDCRDLGYMPAPSAKYLWQANDRKHWEALYNRWLAQWDGSDYYQWEFFEIQPGVRMDNRAEMWLEDADEFGMIFMSIANAYVREPEFEVLHL